MGIFNLFGSKKDNKPVPDKTLPNTTEQEEKEDWGDLVSPLSPIPLAMLDSIELRRKQEREIFEVKYKIELKPQKTYEIV